MLFDKGIAVLLRMCCAFLVGALLLAPVGSYAADEKGGDTTSHASEKAGHDDAHGEHAHIGEEGVSTDVAEVSPDLAVYTFVMFLLLLAVLWKFAWGPIAIALDTREAKIRQDIDDAESARVKAEQMLTEHAAKLDAVQDEVREIVAEARRDAEHTKQEIVEAAQKEAEASKQRAVAEIDRARDAALKELLDTQASQVAQATEHVLGRSLNADDQERLIQDALSQFSNN